MASDDFNLKLQCDAALNSLTLGRLYHSYNKKLCFVHENINIKSIACGKEYYYTNTTIGFAFATFSLMSITITKLLKYIFHTHLSQSKI